MYKDSSEIQLTARLFCRFQNEGLIFVREIVFFTIFIIMKRLLVSFVLFGLLIQSGTQLSILVSFYLQQDYIAKNLCENRKKPGTGCEGKCRLAKELEKDNKREQQHNPNVKEKGIQMLAVDGSALNFKILSTFMTELGDNGPEGRLCDFSSRLFQPPRRA